MKNTTDKFFLAANSFSGFVSKFYDNYFPEKGYRVFIIKGGPGTGKSSFMKAIANMAKEKGFSVSVCPCSSDPDSLDGVIISDLKTVFFDGTSPHVVEAKYPGVCENIIDLGQFWDTESLRKNRYQIISASNINAAFHKTASLYLSACGEMRRDSLKTAKSYTKTDKVVGYAKTLCEKYIPEKPGVTGFEHIRFIEGVTPKGIVTFPETITDNADKIIAIKDKDGSVSSVICEYVRRYAIVSGYEIITLKNPYLPEALTDHIIIPELSLAFVTENDNFKFPKDSKRIYSRRFIDNKSKAAKKKRIIFNGKVEKELLSSAIEVLRKAKQSHDVLEKYYIDSMDFESLGTFSKEFTDNLLRS